MASNKQEALLDANSSFPLVHCSHGKVVVLYSSLNTCDPGDVHETIAKLKCHKVRASVIGLGAEMVSEWGRDGGGRVGRESAVSFIKLLLIDTSAVSSTD